MGDSKAIPPLARQLLVACDDGYAETKVVCEDGSRYRFPSLVRQAPVLGQTNDEVHAYETVDASGQLQIYTTTLESDNNAGSTRYEGYPFSAENRVMIHHALRRAGLGGKTIRLATSLPVADFFDGNAVAVRTLDQKCANVMQKVSSMSGAACADIASTRVFAEGVAAWVDFAVSDQGDFRVSLNGAAAVVDIGGRTTDIVKVLSGLSVEKANSGTGIIGVLDLYDEIARAVARNEKVLAVFPNQKSSSVTRGMVTQVLNTGLFRRRDLEVDMSAEVAAAKAAVAGKILHQIERHISSGFDLDRLLIVGGGAAVLKNEIQAKYKMAEFVDEPEFANARGMLKALKFL